MDCILTGRARQFLQTAFLCDLSPVRINALARTLKDFQGSKSNPIFMTC